MFERLYRQAQANLGALRKNKYPGRGLVLGRTANGDDIVQVYWIMGRSPNSQNRIFVADADGSLRTAAADPSKVEDPSLIIYRAMAQEGAAFVVSNGDQTDTVIEGDWGTRNLNEILGIREYEPDAPSFTPRISGITLMEPDSTPTAAISVLRRSPFGKSCDRLLFEYSRLCPGLGHCVTTYTGDGNPLPPFQGEPYLLPIEGLAIEEIAQTFWDALNEQNRVSLAVKLIDLYDWESRLHIVNQYEQVLASP